MILKSLKLSCKLILLHHHFNKITEPLTLILSSRKNLIAPKIYLPSLYAQYYGNLAEIIEFLVSKADIKIPTNFSLVAFNFTTNEPLPTCNI